MRVEAGAWSAPYRASRPWKTRNIRIEPPSFADIRSSDERDRPVRRYWIGSATGNDQVPFRISWRGLYRRTM